MEVGLNQESRGKAEGRGSSEIHRKREGDEASISSPGKMIISKHDYIINGLTSNDIYNPNEVRSAGSAQSHLLAGWPSL